MVFAGVRFDIVERRYQRIPPEHGDERAEHGVVHLEVDDIGRKIVDHGDDIPDHRVARWTEPPGVPGVVEDVDLHPRIDTLQVLLRPVIREQEQHLGVPGKFVCHLDGVVVEPEGQACHSHGGTLCGDALYRYCVPGRGWAGRRRTGGDGAGCAHLGVLSSPGGFAPFPLQCPVLVPRDTGHQGDAGVLPVRCLTVPAGALGSCRRTKPTFHPLCEKSSSGWLIRPIGVERREY